MERTCDGPARPTPLYTRDMYSVLIDSIELVTTINDHSMWPRTKSADRRRAYHRLIALCRAWKDDESWTLERDIEYITGIRSSVARNAYIAKMAFWWRETAFDGLTSREFAVSKEDYLRNTLASAICGFYRFTLTKIHGCVHEVDVLYERLLAMSDVHSGSDAAARVDALVAAARSK